MSSHQIVKVWGPSLGQVWLEQKEHEKNGWRQDMVSVGRTLNRMPRGLDIPHKVSRGPLRTSEEEKDVTCII